MDYGTSEKYPDISWQTVIEGFPEPVSSQMWVRAVCSADYVDSKGEKQKVELVHWLTQLTDQQAGQLVGQQDLEKLEMEQVMKTDEEAAAYAKIDTDTLRKWVEDGLVKTQEDAFLRYNLDVFIRSQGNPTPEEKAQQVESVQDLAMRAQGAAEGAGGERTAARDAPGRRTEQNGDDRAVQNQDYEKMDRRSRSWTLVPEKCGNSAGLDRAARGQGNAAWDSSIDNGDAGRASRWARCWRW